MSEKGNYILAIIRSGENYETLAESLSDLIKEMQELTDITIDNMNFQLEYFLGGDWKFLARVCGIGAANGEHACIWCKCPWLDQCDTGKHWSLLNPEEKEHIHWKKYKNVQSQENTIVRQTHFLCLFH